jgi:hypothetical protein
MSMVQSIRCKCGVIFAGCVEPYCYEDVEWQRNMRKYIKEGCTVEMTGNDVKLGHCACENKAKKKKGNPNQLQLF